MGHGTIIYLNGTSSSGKTSITRALLDMLMEPYLHCPIDLFEQMIPDSQLQRGIHLDLMRIQSGFTACIAALAGMGNHLIVDDVICEPFGEHEAQGSGLRKNLLYERVKILQHFNILYVKVYCPLCIVEQRELTRGNRTIGLARFQFHRVHQDSVYDVEVDTSTHTAEQCAEQIVTLLSQTRPPRAFQTMAAVFDATRI